MLTRLGRKALSGFMRNTVRMLADRMGYRKGSVVMVSNVLADKLISRGLAERVATDAEVMTPPIDPVTPQNKMIAAVGRRKRAQ